MTFDAWEVGLRPSGDCLAHHGIRGMKHGRRRYQNEDGSWTEVGLAERRKREGFGERRAAKKAERAERRAKRKAAANEAKLKFYEKVHGKKENLDDLTDAQLKARIERVKMEMEYKELTRSPVLKAAENFVTNYMEKKAAKAERAYEEKQTRLSREHEMKVLEEHTKQEELRSKANEKQAEANKARAEADKERANTDRIDIEKGTRLVKLKNDRRDLKLQGKRLHSDTTILGGAKKMVNRLLSGHGEAKNEYQYENQFAKGVVKAQKRIDKYNRKQDPFLKQIPNDPNPWDRQKRPRNNRNNSDKKKGK